MGFICVYSHGLGIPFKTSFGCGRWSTLRAIYASSTVMAILMEIDTETAETSARS